MSRHTIRSGDRRVDYGFDRPLSEYFIQIWNDGDHIDMASGDAGTIFEKAEQYGVKFPPNHAAALGLDLPIGDDDEGLGVINIETFDDAVAAMTAEDVP